MSVECQYCRAFPDIHVFKCDGTVLVLLDLKSAFDTVDHAIMLEGLHSNYAISGLALQWFRSYLAVSEMKHQINVH